MMAGEWRREDRLGRLIGGEVRISQYNCRGITGPECVTSNKDRATEEYELGALPIFSERAFP